MNPLMQTLRRGYQLVYYEMLGKLLPGTMVSSGSPDEQAVALTFDDGPDPPYTQQILDILDQHKVKATFFLVGEQVLQHPTVVQRIAAQGHSIGTHTHTHPRQIKRCLLHFNREIIQPHKLIFDLTGIRPILFRPPYGERDPLLFALLKLFMGYSVIQWSIHPEDWKRDSAEVIAQRVLDHAKPGEIVLLHDTSEETVRALPVIINQLHSQRYRFVIISELLGLSQEREL